MLKMLLEQREEKEDVIVFPDDEVVFAPSHLQGFFGQNGYQCKPIHTENAKTES